MNIKNSLLISENLRALNNKIEFYAKKYGRDPGQIRVVAVSKGQSSECVRECYALGQRDFGENYVQEWRQKAKELQDLPDIRWHLIGPLQPNKVKFLNDALFCLQSLHRVDLAQAIEKKAPFSAPARVLLQLSLDRNKAGLAFAEAKTLCAWLQQSAQMQLCGFLGIGPQGEEGKDLFSLYRRFYDQCHELWTFFPANKGHPCVISLGMSQDFEAAIACGSTLLRIGTAIFGERKQSR